MDKTLHNICAGVFVFLVAVLISLLVPSSAHADFEEYDVAILQSLDKITARTATFEAKVGATLSYGQVFMKVMTCKKRPPIERPEASAFLKVWEVEPGKKPEWIFSGWMFASSPALSAMNRPIYDIWVLDCKNSAEKIKAQEAVDNANDQDQGAVSSEAVQEPKL